MLGKKFKREFLFASRVVIASIIDAGYFDSVAALFRMNVVPLPVAASMTALVSIRDVIPFRSLAITVRKSVPSIDGVDL